LLGERASCPHFSTRCGRDARAPRGFRSLPKVLVARLAVFRLFYEKIFADSNQCLRRVVISLIALQGRDGYITIINCVYVPNEFVFQRTNQIG